jgi:hypothetical protein
MRIGYIALIAVIATMFLSACSFSTAPNSPTGTWTLVTYDGKPIPAIKYGYENTYNERIMSEVLTVYQNGEFRIRTVVRRSNKLDGSPDTDEVYVGSGVWKQTATGVVFGVDAPAEFTDDGMVVRWHGVLSTYPLSVYER